MSLEVGRLCVKLAGRDSGNNCVIVDVVDKNHVLIDGNVRRRKCNITHLMPLDKILGIKKNASTEEVLSAFEKEQIPVSKKEKKKEKKSEAKPAKKKGSVKKSGSN
ncbi:50S ribosomal protein L14e [Candidatus Woesearchaeota archaeon]|nr:50S ribosomal protein L14e [Candidatus Woesearchaeota archaeon]